MKYQILCNGRVDFNDKTRDEALKIIKNLEIITAKNGLKKSMRAIVGASIEYVLTLSNGLTYEMRAA